MDWHGTRWSGGMPQDECCNGMQLGPAPAPLQPQNAPALEERLVHKQSPVRNYPAPKLKKGAKQSQSYDVARSCCMEFRLNHVLQDGDFTQALIHGTTVEVAAQRNGNLVHNDQVHVGHQSPSHSGNITLVVLPHHFMLKGSSVEAEQFP